MFITLPSNLFSSESAKTTMIVKTTTYLYLNHDVLQQENKPNSGPTIFLINILKRSTSQSSKDKKDDTL